MALTPELLAEIKQALADGTLNAAELAATGRSPNRPRQLHDLRLLPTATDPRPTFLWTVEAPRNSADAHKTYPYPRLLWTTDGTEVCVTDAAEHRAHLAAGYLEVDPGTQPVDLSAPIRAMLDSLSPTDRQLVLDGGKKARIKAAIDQLAESDMDIEALVAELAPAKAAKKSA